MPGQLVRKGPDTPRASKSDTNQVRWFGVPDPEPPGNPTPGLPRRRGFKVRHEPSQMAPPPWLFGGCRLWSGCLRVLCCGCMAEGGVLRAAPPRVPGAVPSASRGLPSLGCFPSWAVRVGLFSGVGRLGGVAFRRGRWPRHGPAFGLRPVWCRPGGRRPAGRVRSWSSGLGAVPCFRSWSMASSPCRAAGGLAALVSARRRARAVRYRPRARRAVPVPWLSCLCAHVLPSAPVRRR